MNAAAAHSAPGERPNPQRSIPEPLLAPLAGLPGVRWHILQHGPHRADWPGHALYPQVDGILAPARSLKRLDLLISVDSMPAHLGGALGVPTWTLLPYAADWRWMHGTRTPWYPQMRLFRQRAPGDWVSVVAAVRAALARCSVAGRETRVPQGDVGE